MRRRRDAVEHDVRTRSGCRRRYSCADARAVAAAPEVQRRYPSASRTASRSATHGARRVLRRVDPCALQLRHARRRAWAADRCRIRRRSSGSNAAQSSGDERPVPRWSISTMSRVRRTASRCAANGASSTPPGPGRRRGCTSGSGFGDSVFAGSTATKMPKLAAVAVRARSSGTTQRRRIAPAARSSAAGIRRARCARRRAHVVAAGGRDERAPISDARATLRGSRRDHRRDGTKCAGRGASNANRGQQRHGLRDAISASAFGCIRPPASPNEREPCRQARARTRHRDRSARPADATAAICGSTPARRAAAALRRRTAARRGTTRCCSSSSTRSSELWMKLMIHELKARDRARARRRARAELQDPRARQADPEAVVRAVGGAGDADAVGIRSVSARRSARRRDSSRRSTARSSSCSATRAPRCSTCSGTMPAAFAELERLLHRAVAVRRVPAPPRASRIARPARVRSSATSRSPTCAIPTSSPCSRRSTRIPSNGGTRTTCARSWSTSRKRSSSGASGT